MNPMDTLRFRRLKSRGGKHCKAGVVRHPQVCTAAICRLTGRSSGPATAWHLARAAPWFIVRRTGQAPRRRGPLNSALGGTRMHRAWDHFAPRLHRSMRHLLHGERFAAGLEVSDTTMMDTLAVILMRGTVSRFGSIGHEPHGHTEVPVLQVSPRCASQGNTGATPSGLHRCHMPPNRSFKRTRNGMALGPRGALVYPAPHGPRATPLRAA